MTQALGSTDVMLAHWDANIAYVEKMPDVPVMLDPQQLSLFDLKMQHKPILDSLENLLNGNWPGLNGKKRKDIPEDMWKTIGYHNMIVTWPNFEQDDVVFEHMDTVQMRAFKNATQATNDTSHTLSVKRKRNYKKKTIGRRKPKNHNW